MILFELIFELVPELIFETAFGEITAPPYVRIPCIIIVVLLVLITLRLLFPIKKKPRGKNMN